MTGPGFASRTALERFRRIQPHIEDDVPLARLAEGGPSERTLRRWLARYRVDGIAGLERQKRADQGRRRKIAPELEAMVKSLAVKRPRPALTAIHRRIAAIAAGKNLAVPSYAVVAGIARSLAPALVAAASGNPAHYRDQHELVHRREAEGPNEIWQTDHTLLDIMLLDERGQERRPWLTVVVDDYSRAIAGYFLSFDGPSAVHTALALRQAIWRKETPDWPVCGIPEVLYVDNGSDFISEHIEQACIALKIRLIHSRPGQPRGRGRIERLFRTINDMLLADLPGHLIDGRPLSAPALDLAALSIRFEAFLHGIYHPRPHGGTGLSPLARWQAGGFLPSLPETRQALNMLLLRVAKLRKVQRDGIRFQARRYVEPTLAAFVGEHVEVLYDPRDLAEIQIYHEGRFVCRALCPAHAAAPDLEAISRARAAVRSGHRREIASAEALRRNESRPVPERRRSTLKLYTNDD